MRILIIIAIGAVLLFAFSMYKAIKTARTNKANDEAARQIFLSQLDGVALNADGMPIAIKTKTTHTQTNILTKSPNNETPVNRTTTHQTITETSIDMDEIDPNLRLRDVLDL